MDGIDVKLSCDPRFGFAFSKAEHSDSRNQHYRWIRAAHGRRVFAGRSAVILLVLFSILSQRGVDSLTQAAQILTRRPGHEKWSDFRADKVIRTACAQMGQGRGVAGIHKLQHLRAITEAADHALLA